MVKRLTLFAMGLACLQLACNARLARDYFKNDSEREGVEDPTSIPTPPPVEGYGLEQRVAPQGIRLPMEPFVPGPLTVVRTFNSLTFSEPVYITSPNDGRNEAYVVEKGGRIYKFPNFGTIAATDKKLFLDVSSQIVTASEQGLLGLAFDPDFLNTREFYIYRSAKVPAGDTTHTSISEIVRYRNNLQGVPQEDRVILSVAQPFSNHKGGMITFGPDKMLYIGFGDGGSQNDPNNNAQNPKVFLGKMLRVNPRGKVTYEVPPDNPFVGMAGVSPEIWALGLRNPWRYSFEVGTNKLWLADVGQNQYEEVDILQAGGNYGWRKYEGKHLYMSGEPEPTLGKLTAPIHEYDHASGGSSITGGYVYRGSRAPSLKGLYIFGDFTNGKIWSLNQKMEATLLLQLSGRNISSFGEDVNGEMFIVDYNGGIYQFLNQTTPGGNPYPALLSETGIFKNVQTLEPIPGLLEYSVNSPLWSDGAYKRRWMALPGEAQIEFSATGNWMFPVGTVFVKHFEINLNPQQRRKLETRVLYLGRGGWVGLTYRWNAQQTDAALLEASEADTFDVTDSMGQITNMTWRFPSRADCFTCHTDIAGIVLGVRTGQINGSFQYSKMQDNQLRAWNHIALFTKNIGTADNYPAWPSVQSVFATLESRSRSYLAANCAGCHQPRGPTPSSMDLRFETDLNQMNVVNVPLGAMWIIRPGSKETSVLWQKIQQLGPGRMPPLGSNRVDSDAALAIGRWIDSLQ